MHLVVQLFALLAPVLAADKPPQISKMLDKQLVLDSGSNIAFTLTCQAVASPPATYKWYKGDEEVSKDEAGVTIEGGHLKFSNPSPEHEGYYYCLAKNKFGVAKSTVVHLTNEYQPPIPGKVPPSFLEGHTPENEIKPFGGTADFKCRGKGDPEPEITWYKNGKPMVGKTEDKLVVRNIDQTDVANYACNISNEAGYEYKDVYLSILTQFPTIKAGPREEQVVSKGSRVTLACVAEGYPRPTITWAFNGEDIVSGDKYQVDQDNGDLVIGKVGEEDEGKYKCTASNDDGNDVKEGNIIVHSVTTIVDGPRDTDAKVGTDITMNCTVVYDHSEEITVTWKKDNKDLQINGGRIKVEENYALTITNLEFEDAGDYTCWARTDTSDDTDNGKLKVKVIPPKLKAPEKTVEIMEGDDLLLECVVEEGVPQPKVDWTKDGDYDGEFQEDKFIVNEEKSLVIKNVVKEDAGFYICVASNHNGVIETQEDTIDVVVEVRNRTKIISEAVSYLYEEKQPVMIDCQVNVDADLEGYLKVTWFHGEDQLDLPVMPSSYTETLHTCNSEMCDIDHNEGSGNDVEVDRRLILSNHTLVIHEMIQDDMGEYRCEAKIDKKGFKNHLVLSEIHEIYTFTPFPWWIIVVVILVLLLLLIITCVVCKIRRNRTAMGYYDVSDIEKTGKKHNKSDIYYVPEDVDGDSIMNESDNFLLNDNTEKKTPIFTPKSIRHLNKLETTTGSLGSLFEDDDFIMKGMDEDGSFRERYAE